MKEKKRKVEKGQQTQGCDKEEQEKEGWRREGGKFFLRKSM